MAPKPLHVFIALRDATKNRRQKLLTDAHRLSAKTELYEGHTRTYRPKNDDGDKLPPENKNIQINADTMLNALVEAVSRSWNLMATVDSGNQQARADVLVPTGVGEETIAILENVPAQFLLYLSRELDDVRKFVATLPTLDPSARWEYDGAVAAQVSEPVETHRTKKVLRNHVLAQATERHPAQVQTFTEDILDGYWTHVRRSGALPLERKATLLQRIDTLSLAVKEARERANTTEVGDLLVARPIFDYLFGGTQ